MQESEKAEQKLKTSEVEEKMMEQKRGRNEING